MNYIICDDSREFTELFCKQIKSVRPDCGVTVFNSVEALFFGIEDIVLSTDALFLDIQMPSLNGIETASRLFLKYPTLKIVFVTGYGDRYSQRIFDGPAEFSPVAYIVKPVNIERLRSTLDRIDSLSKRKEKFISLKSRDSVYFISEDEILYISTNGRKLVIHKINENIEVYGKLQVFLTEQLSSAFSQCHRQYAVNVCHIKQITGWSDVLLDNGEKIPIGKSFCETFTRTTLLNRNVR